MAEDGFLAATDRFSFWLQVLAAALLLIVVVILACGYRLNKKKDAGVCEKQSQMGDY